MAHCIIRFFTKGRFQKPHMSKRSSTRFRVHVTFGEENHQRQIGSLAQQTQSYSPHRKKPRAWRVCGEVENRVHRSPAPYVKGRSHYLGLENGDVNTPGPHWDDNAKFLKHSQERCRMMTLGILHIETGVPPAQACNASICDCEAGGWLEVWG